MKIEKTKMNTVQESDIVPVTAGAIVFNDIRNDWACIAGVCVLWRPRD